MVSPQPVAAYSLLYSKIESEDEFEGEHGHRIYTAALSLLHKGPLPSRHPADADSLAPGQTKEWSVYFIPLQNLGEYGKKVSSICQIPVISCPKYNYAPHEKTVFDIHSGEDYKTQNYSPSGQLLPKLEMTEPGVYTVSVTTKSKKAAEAKLYCRRPWMWYLEQARKEALRKPYVDAAIYMDALHACLEQKLVPIAG